MPMSQQIIFIILEASLFSLTSQPNTSSSTLASSPKANSPSSTLPLSPKANSTLSTLAPSSKANSSSSTLAPALVKTTRTATPTANVNLTLSEKISLYLSKLRDLINSLPIPPSTTIGIAIGLACFLFLCCCCICCRFCCKQPEKKRSIKNRLNLRKNHLFGPNYLERVQGGFDEVDYNVESTVFNALDEIKLGQVKFSLEFDGEENCVNVTVHEAKDIPAADIAGTSDAYVKVSIYPVSKKMKKTQVKKGTLNPIFEETFKFKKISYNNLTESMLWLRVYDSDAGLGGDDLLGEAKVPIKDIDLTKGKLPIWKILMPEFKSEAGRFGKNTGLGHICIGLGYAPNTSVLAIFILSCQDLAPLDESGYSDPYVTVYLVHDGKRLKQRKTTVKLRTLNPMYNESFAFEVDLKKIEETSLIFVVADYDKGESGNPIGQCLVGQLGTALGKKQWEQMRRSPGKPVAYWHMLRPVPKPE